MRMDHSLDLTRCSHGLDLGLKCWDCTTEGLQNVRLAKFAHQGCNGCGRPVGPWADYCAECSCEDESDCW